MALFMCWEKMYKGRGCRGDGDPWHWELGRQSPVQGECWQQQTQFNFQFLVRVSLSFHAFTPCVMDWIVSLQIHGLKSYTPVMQNVIVLGIVFGAVLKLKLGH